MSDPTTHPLEVTRRFVIGDTIGEGAMGTVFAASEGRRGPSVAIKQLRPEHRADSDLIARFRSEAAITSAVDHSGAVAVYGQGETPDGLPFYAMQRVDGVTLTDLLAQRGAIGDRFWMDRLVGILVEVCATMGYAHDKRIVHRDLKPDNILVGTGGTVHVLDWGVARDLETDEGPEESGMIIGTPGYLAPEQARGDSGEAGPRADVFALGVMLYEILAGKSPFMGATADESLSRVQHRQPPSPRKQNPWSPRSLAAVCTKALQQDPYRRYADAGELGQDLRAYLEGHETTARRLSFSERLRMLARRRPGMAAALGTLALLLVLAAAGLVARVEFERRTVKRDLAAAHQVDLRIEGLESRSAKLLTGIQEATTAGAPASEVAQLKRERRSTEGRRLMHEVEALVMIRDIARQRLLPISFRPEEEVWRRIYRTLEVALETTHPLVAIGIIDTLRELEAEGELRLTVTAEDRDRLRVLEERANEQEARLAIEGGMD